LLKTFFNNWSKQRLSLQSEFDYILFGVQLLPIFIVPDENITVNRQPGPSNDRKQSHQTVRLHIWLMVSQVLIAIMISTSSAQAVAAVSTCKLSYWTQKRLWCKTDQNCNCNFQTHM